MLKFFWYSITFKKNDYFGRIDKNLDYFKLKKKNWENQLRLSFKSSKGYNSKKKFFKEYLLEEHKAYLNFSKKKLKKNEKILSIGSGRGALELKLYDLGFKKITLTDLEIPTGQKKLNKIFKGVKYKKFNLFKDKTKKKYDVIICMNLLYAFNKSQIKLFFISCSKLLNKNGRLILSPGHAPIGLTNLFYNFIYLPLECFLFFLYFKIKGKKVTLFRYHHGFLFKKNEIIDIALTNNFILSEKVFRNDFLSEFKRSLFLRKFINKDFKKNKILKILGRFMTFANIHYFKLK